MHPIVNSSAPLRLLPFSLVYIATFARFAVVYPYLVLWLKDAGLTKADVSVVMLAIAVPSLVMQQAWGYVADVVMTRRHTLMILFPAAALVFASFFAAPLLGGGQLSLTVAVLLGLAFGSVNSPIAQMLNGLVFGDPEVSARFPVLRSVGSAGFIVASLALGAATSWGKLPLHVAAWCFALLTLLALLGLRTMSCRQKRTSQVQHLTFRQVQSILVANPRLTGILVFVLLYETAFGMSYYTLQPFFIQEELGLGTDIQSYCTALAAISEIPFFLIGDWLIRRYGSMRCLFAAACMNAARWALLHHATEGWQVVALSSLHSITFGVFYFGVVRYINLHGDVRLKASSQGMLGIVFYGLSTIAGNGMAWLLLEKLELSVRDCFLVTAILATVALLYLMLFWAWNKQWDRRDAEATVIDLPDPDPDAPDAEGLPGRAVA